MSWEGSYQTSNVSAYYDAQKHAHMWPGTTVNGSAGSFQWNIRDHSGAHRCWLGRARQLSAPAGFKNMP